MSLVLHRSDTDKQRNLIDSTELPVRLLTDSPSPLYSVRFSTDGSLLAAGGKDKGIYIWDLSSIPTQDLKNGVDISSSYSYQSSVHKSAITSIRWSNITTDRIFLSSADSTACAFDLTKETKIKTFHHQGTVNEVDVSKRDLVVTCSDDGSVRVWDLRSKFPISEVNTDFPVLTCCIEPNERGIFFAGIDPEVKCYDPRNTTDPVWAEKCQSNNVTSLSLSPKTADYLVSKSIDGTIKYFDSRLTMSSLHKRRAKPYVFDGAQASEDDWLIRAKIVSDSTGKLSIISGSNDGFIYIWDFASRRLLSRLGGHSGAVYSVDYANNHIVSCSVDGSLIFR